MEQKIYPEFPVLVVDDEKNFLNSIESTMLFNGITNVECCQDSEKVMNLLENKQYSVVLLDLVMPGTSGMELLPRIVGEFPKIPVIILTGYPDMVKLHEFKKLGASNYWQKNNATKELIEKIQNALELDVKADDITEKFDDLEYKTTIYFSRTPPEFFSENEEGLGIEKEFLKSFFQMKTLKIEIEFKGKEGVINIPPFELKGTNGLIFRYLAYKNYKALKNPEYRDWKDIPDSPAFRLSGVLENNVIQIPEWNILSEYLGKIFKKPKEGTIKSWVNSLKGFLKSEEVIPDIIETTEAGRGRGYLLKGVVVFLLN